MTYLVRRSAYLITAVVAALAVAGSLGSASARADEEPAVLLVDEIAGALGFADSHAPGFWEALAAARAQELEALEHERAVAAQTVVRDALTFGRHVETTDGNITRFVEYVPGASGDVFGGDINVRIGYEVTNIETGTVTRTTRYYTQGSFSIAAQVTSEIKDGVETVTEVVEREPGVTDLKVGDARSVPPQTTSAAGKKPSTFDPKKDGSLGRASGNQPDEPLAPIAGTRHEWETLHFENGHAVKAFEEFVPPSDEDPSGGLLLRSGHEITDERWPKDVSARVTLYADKNGKIAGLVASVTEAGKETVVAVEELVPGSIQLKPGDSRPAPNGPAGKPKTWNPNPSGSTGSGSSSTGSNSEPPKETRPEVERQYPAPREDNADDSSDDWQLVHHTSYSNKDGSSAETDTYKKGSEDLFMDVTTTTDANGDTKTEKTCYSSQGTQECPSGMTDEPACRTDCARLALFTVLFCSGCSAGFDPFYNNGEPSNGPRPPLSEERSWTAPIKIAYWAWSAGAPKDWGDPNDPMASDPIPYVDPRFDGNTDPLPPDEIAAAVSTNIANEVRSALRDPVGPVWDENSAATAPPPPPSPGDDE
jgi:hypothetical protein